jgi:hypothetical protein
VPTRTCPPATAPASSSTSTAPRGPGCPRRPGNRSAPGWPRWSRCPPPTPGR